MTPVGIALIESRSSFTHILYQTCKHEILTYDYTKFVKLGFPEMNLTNNPRNPTKVAVCDGFKSNSNNRVCLPLTQIPQCIHNVPYAKRKYLSRLSLGRSAGWCKSLC